MRLYLAYSAPRRVAGERVCASGVDATAEPIKDALSSLLAGQSENAKSDNRANRQALIPVCETLNVRTLGLIGGCSAESTSIYYARINQLVRERRPGHGAKLLLWSFDFDEIDACCRAGDWDLGLEKFVAAAGWLQAAGAQAILLCTNTMHRIAEPLAARLDTPLIHIVDQTAAAIQAAGLRRPILLGTRFTMTEAFYRQRLERFGLEVFLPDAAEQAAVHAVIYDELIAGQITDSGRRTLTSVIERLAAQGSDSVVLGCTELGLLIRPEDVSVPVFDTAEVHIAAAVAFALDEATDAQTSVG